jgi:uncharacterized Ntn-hydrolase superfamily protein
VTFSLCVHEPYVDGEGTDRHRFGVAVTSRLAGVGTLCPFANEHGAVATQSLVNVELGRKGLEYLADGLAVEDALEALLNADDGTPNRQLHGVDADGSFVFSGEECKPWFGHHDGSDAVEGHYTVAGNLLTGEEVIESVADAYEAGTPPHGTEGRAESDATPGAGDGSEPLSKRLVDALEAGHEAGGDKREELTVQSAALVVEDTEERPFDRAYTDLRVDATETPIADLRETYELAVAGHRDAMARYADAYDEDSMDDIDDG